MTRPSRFVFAGGVGVVTGAASGIGEQLAYQLAARGSQLALVDRHADRLAAVARRCTEIAPGVRVTRHVCDLAETGALPGLGEAILTEHHRVNLLINNAGVALGGRFADLSLAEFDWLMRINLQAPVHLTHALLPALTAAPGAHIVNLSSIFGVVAVPGQTAYCTSKAGLRGFSESLRTELAPSGVGVTTVHPGGIRTGIARSAPWAASLGPDVGGEAAAAFDRMLTYPADRAATEILAAVERRRRRLLIAASAKVPDLLARAMPVGHTRLIDLVAAGRARLATDDSGGVRSR